MTKVPSRVNFCICTYFWRTKYISTITLAIHHYHKNMITCCPKGIQIFSRCRAHTRNKKYFSYFFVALITPWIIYISSVFTHHLFIFSYILFCMRVREALKPILFFCEHFFFAFEFDIFMVIAINSCILSRNNFQR